MARRVGKAKAAKNGVKDILRIIVPEPVMHGVLKLVWNDSYEGLVDLRGIMSRAPIFEFIRDPDYFRQVRVQRYGHSIYWFDDEFTEIDFGCDRLRELAEEQAALIADAG